MCCTGWLVSVAIQGSDSVFNLSICMQSGHRVGLSRIGFRIGASIVRLHLQDFTVQSMGYESRK